MVEIQLNTVGKVLNGRECGTFIKVIADLGEGTTGGFYILESKSGCFGSDTFDGWFEDFETVQAVFKEREWQVSWIVSVENKPK